MLDLNGNGILDPIDIGVSLAVFTDEYDGPSEKISLAGYTFHFVQELEPDRDEAGKIRRFIPWILYEKKDEVPLNKYGKGPFCKFSLDSKSYNGISGIYAIFDTQGLLYIGQAADLGQRFNAGYGNISPRNCYVGGQNTNCKINNLILNKYLEGERVFLYFHKTKNLDAVEKTLIKRYKPPYNGSSN